MSSNKFDDDVFSVKNYWFQSAWIAYEEQGVKNFGPHLLDIGWRNLAANGKIQKEQEQNRSST